MLTHVILGATEDFTIRHAGGTLWVRVEVGPARGESRVFASQDGEAFRVRYRSLFYRIEHAGESMRFRIAWPPAGRDRQLPRLEIVAEQSWRFEWNRKPADAPVRNP